MSYIHEPEIEEEEDNGYSIPKILVAVLLLVLIGAVGYIVYQTSAIKGHFNRYEAEKQAIENNLEAMKLKYELAIEENGDLSGDLTRERDRIIRFRDSVKRLKESDFKNVEEYNKAIAALKNKSAVGFDAPKISENKAIPTQTNVENNATNSNQSDTKVTSATIEVAKENTNTLDSKPEPAATAVSTVTGPQTFERVEIPPTFPGCTGDVVQKKACFNQKVKGVIAKKFDPNVASEAGVSSGTQKVMVNFTIDKFGNVTNIKARGTHPKIEAEAIKAAKSLPKMTAARQNGAPVDVVFSVPISFMVE